MKITLVTEHKIIIGILRSAVNTTEPRDAKHICCSGCGPDGHIANSFGLAACGGSEGHIALDPLQASDTPLGTPPKPQVATGPLPYHDDYCICDECMAAIAAANAAAQSGEPAALPQTLPPCAEGDTLSLVIIIGNVVERNG